MPPGFRVFALLSSLLWVADGLTAQGTGTSTLVDVSSEGTPVPAVSVSLRNEATGFTTRSLTSFAGLAVFNQLPLGAYSVTVERIGLRSETRTGIEVVLGGRTAIDIDLAPAAIAVDGIVVAAAANDARLSSPVCEAAPHPL